MNLEEAQKIVNIWGVYMEHTCMKLILMFGGYAPESLLPFEKNKIEEALNILAAYYHKLGNQEAVKDLQSGIGLLTGFSNDKEAVQKAAKSFSDEKWQDAILPAIKKLQNK